MVAHPALVSVGPERAETMLAMVVARAVKVAVERKIVAPAKAVAARVDILAQAEKVMETLQEHPRRELAAAVVVAASIIYLT
jgi:hypothetical protein